MATILTQGFESGGTIPSGWVDTNVSGTLNPYTYASGGYNANPAVAHTGSYNALCYKASFTASVQRLETPKLNLIPYSGITLTFWHAQAIWISDQDELRVYYKTGSTGSWTIISGAVYTTSITNWTQESFSLPSTSASSEYQIGFEATAKYGYGVVIDDVLITGDILSSVATTPSSLSNFNYIDVTKGPSSQQSFVLYGYGVSGVTAYITPPSGYEVSFSSTTNYQLTGISISNYNGDNTTIYTRLTSGLSVSNYSGNISITGSTFQSAYVYVDGSVISSPIANSSNLSSNSIGLILVQSGNGYPVHNAAKGSIYTDILKGSIYINKDGVKMWAALQPVAYGAIFLPYDTTAFTLTNANTWYVTSQIWLVGDCFGISGTTNGRLYVNKNRGGRYKVLLSVDAGGGGTADDFDVGILVNGTTVPNNLWRSYDIASSASWDAFSIAGEINLNAGDYITMAVRNPVAAGTTTYVPDGTLFLKKIADGSY